jgi:hypothetical protein
MTLAQHTLAVSDQMNEAYGKNDKKMVDELSQKIDRLEKILGPEYVALMDGLQKLGPENKKRVAEIMLQFAALEIVYEVGLKSQKAPTTTRAIEFERSRQQGSRCRAPGANLRRRLPRWSLVLNPAKPTKSKPGRATTPEADRATAAAAATTPTTDRATAAAAATPATGRAAAAAAATTPAAGGAAAAAATTPAAAAAAATTPAAGRAAAAAADSTGASGFTAGARKKTALRRSRTASLPEMTCWLQIK